jgi:hypothetical protein
MNILNRTDETNVRKQLIEEIRKHFYTLDANYKCENSRLIIKGMYYNQKKPKQGISKNRLRNWERYKIVPLNIVDQCIEAKLISKYGRAANLHIKELAQLITQYEKDRIRINSKPPQPQQSVTIIKQVIQVKNHSCVEKTCSNNNHGLCSTTPYQSVVVGESIVYCKRYRKMDLGTPIAIGAESWMERKS